MAMVALIDRPNFKVEVRADLADQYEVCWRCNGHPTRYACVGADLYGSWQIFQEYACCDCGNGIRKRSAP